MYLKGRTSHDMFSDEKGDSRVVGYVNLEYAGDVYYRMSTTVYVFTLVWGPIFLEIISSIYGGHVNNWSRVNDNIQSCQRSFAAYMIGDIIGCWAIWSSVTLW